jgi:hypothetical protein
MKVNFSKKIFYGIGIVIVVVVLYVVASGMITGSTYQAVFLSNNQVYFGKLSGTFSRFSTLKEVYYLRVSQQLQAQDPNTPPQSQIQLVKLGSEIHGPTSDMKINRDQILFIENLKDDSQVVKAILDQKKAAEKVPTQ